MYCYMYIYTMIFLHGCNYPEVDRNMEIFYLLQDDCIYPCGFVWYRWVWYPKIPWLMHRLCTRIDIGVDKITQVVSQLPLRTM